MPAVTPQGISRLVEVVEVVVVAKDRRDVPPRGPSLAKVFLAVFAVQRRILFVLALFGQEEKKTKTND